MNNDINKLIINRCLAEVKYHLKAKNLKYVDIAKHLDVSENTVKRMLNHSDISLDRLLTLAEICDVNVGHLIDNAKSTPNPHHLFSDRQDEAFDNSPHLMSYFSELFHHKKTAKDIAEENSLSDVSSYRYLRELENIELLELLPNNKVRFLVQPPIGFNSNSRVLKKVIAKFIQQTCDVVMSPKRDEEHFMRVKPLHMPHELFIKLGDELKQVVDRYAELAELAYVGNDSLPDYQVAIVGHPLNTDEFHQAKIINID